MLSRTVKSTRLASVRSKPSQPEADCPQSWWQILVDRHYLMYLHAQKSHRPRDAIGVTTGAAGAPTDGTTATATGLASDGSTPGREATGPKYLPGEGVFCAVDPISRLNARNARME